MFIRPVQYCIYYHTDASKINHCIAQTTCAPTTTLCYGCENIFWFAKAIKSFHSSVNSSYYFLLHLYRFMHPQQHATILTQMLLYLGNNKIMWLTAWNINWNNMRHSLPFQHGRFQCGIWDHVVHFQSSALRTSIIPVSCLINKILLYQGGKIVFKIIVCAP